MSIITCTECLKEYSDKASSCIHCGCPTEINVQPEEETEIVITEQRESTHQEHAYQKEEYAQWQSSSVDRKDSYSDTRGSTFDKKSSTLFSCILLVLVVILVAWNKSQDPCKYLDSRGIPTSAWNSGGFKGCASKPIEIFDYKNKLKNTITYYRRAGELKLDLWVKNKAFTKNSYEKLITLANHLSERHTGIDLPEDIAKAIRNQDKLPFSMASKNFRWTIKKVSTEGESFHLVFTIKDKKPEQSNTVASKTQKSSSKHRLLESSSNLESRFNNTAFLTQMQSTIRRAGYKCDSFSSILEMNFSRGFTVRCNNYVYGYEIEDKGGNWVVTLD